MRIRVWYTDGREYRATTRKGWERLPRYGFLYAVRFRDTGRTMYSGGDHYWLDEDIEVRYTRSGEWGTEQPPPPDVPERMVKHGIGVTDDEFAAVHEAAWGSSWR